MKKNTGGPAHIDIEKFKKAAIPMIKYLNKHHNPHVSVVITHGSAAFLSEQCFIPVYKYIKD